MSHFSPSEMIERAAALLEAERPVPSTPAWNAVISTVRRLSEAVSDLKGRGPTAAQATMSGVLRACAARLEADPTDADQALGAALRLAVVDLDQETRDANLTSSSLQRAALQLLGLLTADEDGPARSRRFIAVLRLAADVIDASRAYDLAFHTAATGPILVNRPRVGDVEIPVPFV